MQTNNEAKQETKYNAALSLIFQDCTMRNSIVKMHNKNVIWIEHTAQCIKVETNIHTKKIEFMFYDSLAYLCNAQCAYDESHFVNESSSSVCIGRLNCLSLKTIHRACPRVLPQHSPIPMGPSTIHTEKSINWHYNQAKIVIYSSSQMKWPSTNNIQQRQNSNNNSWNREVNINLSILTVISNKESELPTRNHILI